MPQPVTVRVALGPYVLHGREVEAVAVHQAVGAHARCELAFLRDPRAAASGVAALRLGELADAVVRVVFVAGGAEGADGADEWLAFEGRVREATVDHLATGAGHVSVVALSDSCVLGAHADRQYLAHQTVPALAARFGMRVAGAVPAGAARDSVQAGESAWAFLARVAAEEGLQLRACWPRTPGGAAGEAADAPAELGRGFADATHALTWGRELVRLATGLAPANAGVTGAFYDPAEKHDHRFRGVRASAAWLGGAGPVVAAAKAGLTRDAGGGDPGHVEPGGAGGRRARTLAEFRDRLERESGRRAGAAVRARGTSVAPALRAGDRIAVAAAPTVTLDGVAPALDDPTVADRTGVFGLTAVTHRWTGGLYENTFEATPWADYHVVPAAAARDAATADGAPAGREVSDAAGYALAVVVDAADPSGRGRVKVRYAAMAGAEATHWARVAGLGGGNGRGLGALPGVGDEVLVAAVAGDPEHPVVVGALWNGVDRAGHAPGRQHWVTAAGSALAFREGEGAGAHGGSAPTAELYTRAGQAGLQLMARGPAGVPLVTLYAAGDLALEAPRGQLRVTARRYVAHVADAHATRAGGAHTVQSAGAVTAEGGARVALRAGGELAVRAGGALHAHAGGLHTLTGTQVLANPPGATAPRIRATVPVMPGSAWGPRPVPAPGPGRSTEDPRTPTRTELAAKAARASMAAAPARRAHGPSAADDVGVTGVAESPARDPHFPPGVPAELRTPEDCRAAWGAFGREAQGVLQAGGTGDGDADPVARNRAISQAYAQFYQRNPRLEWAGIASIVSSNAGCAMRAADAVRADAEREIHDYSDAQRYAVPPGDGGGGAEFLVPSTRAWAAGMAHDALAKGNKEIFRNIYPTLRMHERYGDAGLSRCSVRWDGQPVPQQVRSALGQADSDDPDIRQLAGDKFADYEQKEVLERQVMNGRGVKPVFLMNQLASKTSVGRALGAQAPEVRLTSGCDDGTPAVPFDGLFTDKARRAAYYSNRLVPAFESLSPTRRDAVIGQLARGRAGEAP